MLTLTVRPNIDHGQYWLYGSNAETDASECQYVGGNGLVWVHDRGDFLVVLCGVSYSDMLPVTFCVLDAEPQPELDGWDDVVEVSMTNIPDGLWAGGPLSDPLRIDLTTGAAVYRLRIHVRGRDRSEGQDFFEEYREEGDPELAEQHLIQIWPAPAAPEIRWKLTDESGARSRSERPHVPGEPSPIQTKPVRVTKSQYDLLSSRAVGSARPPRASNGLVWVNPEGEGAVVYTGVRSGLVRVTCSVLDAEPEPELDGWTDVVEVSMTVTGETVMVIGPVREGSLGFSVYLPAVGEEVHSYRLRIHVRGRDIGQGSQDAATRNGDDAVEEHLILIWPAPPSPEVRWKLLDQVGAWIRAQQPFKGPGYRKPIELLLPADVPTVARIPGRARPVTAELRMRRRRDT